MNDRGKQSINQNIKSKNSKVTKTVRPAGQRKAFYENPYLLLFFILLLTTIAFLPSLKNNFIPTWDDGVYITDNFIIHHLNQESLRWMFTTQINGTYVPLPLLTFAIEYKLFGLNPFPYHLSNLVLHLLCTVMVFLILRSLKLKPLYASLGALLFGIHPMRVESVAWITERKDLLYSVFYLLAIVIYFKYLENRKRGLKFIILSLCFFILALFSKIQAVTLPLSLLLIDYYLERPLKTDLIVEKIPYFILSLVFGILGIIILKTHGILEVHSIFGFPVRVLFGFYSLSAYIVKFFAPLTLSSFYPYPVVGKPLSGLFYLSPPFILLSVFLIYMAGRRHRAIVFGSLFFLLNVVFLLQVVGAGQAFIADRFTYIPYIGFFFMVAWVSQTATDANLNMKYILIPFFIAVFFFFTVMTYEYCKIWQNGETLWTNVIKKFPLKNPVPYENRGGYYRSMKLAEKALADYNTAISMGSKDAELIMNRGNIYFDKGYDNSAYSDYLRSLKLRKGGSHLYGNLGAIYARRNQMDSALLNLNRSLQMDPWFSTSYANRAFVYDKTGNYDASIKDFKKYLEFKPADEKVFSSIGKEYLKKGDYPEAIKWYDKAIAKRPDFGNYYRNRSQAWLKLGDKEKALQDANTAKKLEFVPDHLENFKGIKK